MSKPVKIGSWGGSGGGFRDARATPERLVCVKVNASSTFIRSISFYYSATDGKMYQEGPWGALTRVEGSTDYEIDLGSWDSISEISGTTGSSGGIDDCVMSLKFVTESGTFGPYGRLYGGTPFRVTVLDNGSIDGFFGRSGSILDAIGIYVNAN